MLNCDNCTNCKLYKDRCYFGDVCEGWYLYLEDNDYFAKGFDIGIKQYDTIVEKVKYMHGDHWFRRSEKFIKEWAFDELHLDWQPMEKPYVPTTKDKLLKFLFKKEYPKTIENRPKDKTLVITNYGDNFYELAEFDNHYWVTKLYFPILPTQWAYIPQEIIKLSNK